MPSNRICEAFHAMIDILYERYAKNMHDILRWRDLFPEFAAAFSAMGAPFRGMIGIINGNFMQICRPFGKGNWISTLEQQEFYSGKEKAHGIKSLAVVLANGMVCIFGPSFGRRHDSHLMKTSGWLKSLEDIEHRDGSWFHFFADCAFGLSRYLQVMYCDEKRLSVEPKSYFQRSHVPHPHSCGEYIRWNYQRFQLSCIPHALQEWRAQHG